LSATSGLQNSTSRVLDNNWMAMYMEQCLHVKNYFQSAVLKVSPPSYLEVPNVQVQKW